MSLKAGHEAATNIGAASSLLYLQTSERSNIPVDLLRWIVDRRPRNVFLRLPGIMTSPSPYGYHRKEFQHHGTGLDVCNCSFSLTR